MLALLMIIWTLTGRYQEMMSQAVSKVSPQLLAGTSPEAMATGFIVISVIVALVIIGIGYFLVIFADKGKKWAQWLFLLSCLWLIISQAWDIWNSNTILQMYPELFPSPLYELVIGILTFGILIVLIWKVILLIRNQQIPMNQTLQSKPL